MSKRGPPPLSESLNRPLIRTIEGEGTPKSGTTTGQVDQHVGTVCRKKIILIVRDFFSWFPSPALFLEGKWNNFLTCSMFYEPNIIYERLVFQLLFERDEWIEMIGASNLKLTF